MTYAVSYALQTAIYDQLVNDSVVNTLTAGNVFDADEAAAFLRLLSGRRHRVITAIGVRLGERSWHRTAVSAVKLKRLSEVGAAAERPPSHGELDETANETEDETETEAASDAGAATMTEAETEELE